MDISFDSILQTVLDAFINGGSATLSIYGTVLLPQVVVCLLLLFLGRFMNTRLWKSFDWKGVMFLAWLGTPVHELSHLLGCIIGRNRIEEFALFKPDRQSGSLGYVKHSYRSDSFYERVIGNTIVAIAPFFGGALVIYLLTHSLYPQVLLRLEDMPTLSWQTFASWSAFTDFFADWEKPLKALYAMLSDERNLKDWGFWVYIWAMISVGAHLSPSRSDFEGFWGAAILLLCLPFVAMFILSFFGSRGESVFEWLSTYAARINILLLIALLFTALGAALVTVVTFIKDILTRLIGRA